MGKVGKVLLIVWASLMTVIAVGLSGLEAMRFFGKSNLDSKSATVAPVLVQSTEEAPASDARYWEDD